MNCQQSQKGILDALAAGEAKLPGRVAAHQQDCAGCQAYFESQARLFRQLEEGLTAIANEEVPASLLPRVRARLDEKPPQRYSWMPGWGLAAIAAVILGVSLGFVLHQPKHHALLPENVPMAARGAENPVPGVRPPRKVVTPSLNQGHEHGRAFAAAANGSETVPEVIVLPEEQAAFSKFVRQLREQQEVILAVAHAAPANDDLPAEIASLEIEGLEMKPLDPSWE
jgi:anti-sigma factor RsiW